MPTRDVVFLPGIIAPAAKRYEPLLHYLADVNPVVKELEVYQDDAPPDGYSIATEVDGVLRVANEAGVERFHLYGHSAGGAVALALALRVLRHFGSTQADDRSASRSSALR